MRITANDPQAVDAIVYWNDTPSYAFVAVDTDEGWGDQIVFDDAGKMVVEGDGPKIERVYGTFRVEFPRRGEA